MNLKKSCSEHGERIKIFKIHGDAYQEPGISDWLGCYQGVFVAIEFKVDDTPTPVQFGFLVDVLECDGIGLYINFKNTKPIEYCWGQERQVIRTSLHDRKKAQYIFSY